MTRPTPRFSQLTTAQLSDEQRPLAEQIEKISSVGIGGPYNLLLLRCRSVSMNSLSSSSACIGIRK
jgi:hypothetical protein